jgi:hypothetical protein
MHETYYLRWVSLLGATNVGTYAYGTAADWAEYYGRTKVAENDALEMETIGRYRSRDAANMAAERSALRDRIDHGARNQHCNIDAAHISNCGGIE